MNSSALMTVYAAPPPSPPPPEPSPAEPRRRFRASDVATHLDMLVIGDVCVGVTLPGYQSVLSGFLNDEGGSAAALLAALDQADTAGLGSRAHAVKGAAASLGLRTVHAQALRIESAGADFSPADCTAAACSLRYVLATTRALLQRMGFL